MIIVSYDQAEVDVDDPAISAPYLTQADNFLVSMTMRYKPPLIYKQQAAIYAFILFVKITIISVGI